VIPTIFIVGEGVGEEQGRPMTFFGNLMRIVADRSHSPKMSPVTAGKSPLLLGGFT
jgi:hypothetical protein